MKLLRPLAAAAVVVLLMVSPAHAVTTPTATISVPTTTPAEGTSILVSGTVSHVATGSHVTFQHDIGHGWVAVRSLTVGKAGHYSASYTAVLGRNKIRIYVPRSGSRHSATSRVITLTGPLGVTPTVPRANAQIHFEGRLPTAVARTVVLQTSEPSGWVTRTTGKSSTSGSMTLTATFASSKGVRVVAPQVTSHGKVVYPELHTSLQRVEVTPPPLNLTPTPTITGSAQFGATLTAVPGSWDPGVVLSWQWRRGGTPIDGATQTAYSLGAADVDHTITVSATGTKSGYAATTRTSAPTTTVQWAVLVPTTKPTISGEPSVGGQLEVVAGQWAPGATLAYQWLRDGTVISGASSAKYVIPADDAASQLSVRVTGSKPGYATVVRTSDPTGPVLPPDLAPAPTPTIVGTAAVGHALTVDAGSWAPGAVLTYQWQRSGVNIAGETAESHVVSAGDVGAQLAVRVTGTKPGLTPVARTSALTSVVSPGVLQTSKPKILGTPQPGTVLTADPGRWSPDAVDLTYQWLRDDAPIDGATHTSYTLTDHDSGSLLRVTVSGSEPGYTAETTFSDRVAVPGPQSASKVARALRTFHSALQDVDKQPVDIFAGPSDSLTEGYRASSVNKRWTNALADDLRQKYQPSGVPGGEGYSDPLNFGAFPDYPISFVQGIGNFSIGLGREGLALFDPDSQSITVDDTYSDLDILYTGVSDGSYGSFSYTVDGGAPVVVNTGDKPAKQGGYVAKISGLGLGHHVVVIREGAHGPAMIEGVMLYSGDRNSGVRMWEGGHNGMTAADYVAPNTSWADPLAYVDPDLVVLGIGSNDFAAGTSAADTRARIEDIIKTIRSHVDTNPSIVLLSYYDRPSTGSEPWSSYINMYKSIAATDPDVCVFDLDPLFGPFKGDTRGGLMSPDLLHPSDAGYSLIASSLADFLAAP